MILTTLQCDACPARLHLHSIEIRIRARAHDQGWSTVADYGTPDRDYCPNCTSTRREISE